MTWPQAHIDHLIATHGRATAREQAEQIGVSYRLVRKMRGKLIADGLIESCVYRYRHLDMSDLIEMVQDGLGVDTIGKKTGMSANAIYHVLARYGRPLRKIRRGVIAVRTANEVCALFDVPYRNVQTWMRTRRLHFRRALKGSPPRLISDDALLRFIQSRDNWPLFDPERITDPDWRDAALSVRHGGRWWTADEVAHATAYSVARVRLWGRTGVLSAQYARGRWWFWVKEGEAPKAPRTNGRPEDGLL